MALGLAHRAGLRYLVRHPWLAGLSVLGIALGVAVVVSIDLANASAQRAFDLSATRVAGDATHAIVGTESISGAVYRRLRVEAGVRQAAPIVEGYVSRGGRTLQVLGIDPLADRAFRSYTADLSTLGLGAFLSDRSIVLIPPSIDAAEGDTLQVRIAGRSAVVEVGGTLVPEDEVSRAATANLIVTDIGTAQRIFGLGNRLSRIDLKLENGEAGIGENLPPGTRLVRSDARTQAVDQMTDAFELNLDALSLLALVVAMFLIYNTVTFSVVQRRGLFGRLRAIGLTRREIFSQVLLEAVVLGVAGAALGLVLGMLLAQGLVRLVTQTINDLYYTLEVRSVTLDVTVLMKAAGLGIVATALAAVPPAREAGSSPVHVVLQRSEEERTLRRRLPGLTAAGIVTCTIAGVVLMTSGRNLVLSYAGLALILAGFALLTPGATMWAARAFRRLLGRPFGLVGRMAAQGVVHHLSRTSVAIAALSIAVAAAVGVGVMVGSFRDTVTNWLDYTLQADLYVQPANARLGQGVLSTEWVDRLAGLPGVRAVSSVRRLEIELPSGVASLAAVESGPSGLAAYHFTVGDPQAIWADFERGSALVSEPLAYRLGLSRGDSLAVPTDRGPATFAVAGIYYDYGSDQGTALLTRSAFIRWFDARGLSGISIYAAPEVDLAALEERVRAEIDVDVVVRSNRILRDASLEVFDRTFAITAVLRVLALLVAFAGVVSALMALQIERASEFAVLRAEGMTPGLLRRFIALQTGVIGAISGLLALPLGIVLAGILVFVINKRSFGWTLSLSIHADILLEAFGLALAAALLAGVYPAAMVERTGTAQALRAE